MPDESNEGRWLHAAANLRTDRKGGQHSPHKPLMLMVVTDLFESGLARDGRLNLTGELAFRFNVYFSVPAWRRTARAEVRLPFFHLHSDGFWTPLDADGKQARDRKSTQTVEIAPDFLACLNYAEFRTKLRRVLINTYFGDAEERAALYSLVGLPMLEETGAAPQIEQYAESVRVGRQARFRLNVVSAYNFTCALTGYRCVTVSSGSIVDAAHIHQFSESGNNDPTNGMALSKNAHWLFDQGLWSISDEYSVIVATDRFHETGDETTLLRSMAGRKIYLPKNSKLWPSRVHLEWHRNNRFREAF